MIADGKLRASPLNSLIQVAKQLISLQRVDMQITRQICYYLMFKVVCAFLNSFKGTLDPGLNGHIFSVEGKSGGVVV